MPTPTITITINEYFATKLSKNKKHRSHKKEEGHGISTIASSGSNVSVKKVNAHLCKRKVGCVHFKIITRSQDAEYTCKYVNPKMSQVIKICKFRLRLDYDVSFVPRLHRLRRSRYENLV